MEINTIQKVQSNSSFVFFNWPLCDKCNYNCSYCYTNNDDTWIHDQHKVVIARLKMVKRKFRVCLTGGETTEHPEIINIVNELSKNEYTDQIFLFTNLSKSLDFYKNINLSENITIIASYHPEYDNLNFIKKCIELNKIRKSNFRVNISISDEEKYWDKTQKIFETLILNNVLYNINFLISTNKKSILYSSSVYNRFEKYFKTTKMYDEITVTYSNKTEILSNHELRKYNINNFKNYKCCAQSYQINQLGEFINTCSNEKLPLFIKDEYFDKNIFCPLTYCEGDVKITYTKELI